MRDSHKSLALLVLYGLSGVTALGYEVLWTRMLSLFFGISILGVVVTVAAFMLGLGLGSLLATRYTFSLKRTWYILATIECVVAIYAVILPSIMHILQGLWLHVDQLQVWAFWQISSALLALSLPATALGFAFPSMLRVGKSCKLSLAQLYGVNTIGGAIGALLPLLLLPWLGWLLALKCFAILGMMIALGLFWLSKVQSDSDAMMKVEMSVKIVKPNIYMMLAYAGMGAGALMLEIAWTRAYGMVMLRTEYVLAVILAVFLMGIGVGSIWARYIKPHWGLTWLPIMIAVAALLGLYAFPHMNAWAQSFHMNSLMGALWLDAILIAVFTFPVTLALGAWLPLIAQDDEGGRLYAINSLGACMGALLAGFVCIPWLGTALTWLLAVTLIVVCACYWQVRSRLWYALASISLLMLAGWPVKALPEAAVLLKQELPHAHDMYQFEDAVSITHVVEKDNGQRVLLSDLQRMDASSDATSVEVQKNQARLPLFLHGSAKDVLFLGLGTGITASGALAWHDVHVQSVELSKGAIHAATFYFNRVNDDVVSHTGLVHDDARRFLMRTHQSYDVIVGDLFHPDMVGRGALLSVEQFERAKAKLNQDGVFVQWLAFNQFDIPSLQVVLHSFERIFPHNAIFVDGYRMGLVGFQGQFKSASLLKASAPPENQWGGEGAWTWLGRYWGDASDLLKGATSSHVQSEWAPVLEYRLPHMRYHPASLPDVLLWLMQHRVRFEQGLDVWQVNPSDQTSFKRSWAASLFNMRAQYLALTSQPNVSRFQQLAYQANPRDRWAAFGLADAMFDSLNRLPKGMSKEQALERILSIRDDHEEALKALIKLKNEEGNQQAAKGYMNKLRSISPYMRLDV